MTVGSIEALTFNFNPLVAYLTLSAEPADQYLRTFAWNKVKYRADKPLAELIDSLQKVSEALPRQFSTANARG